MKERGHNNKTLKKTTVLYVFYDTINHNFHLN